MDFAKQEFGCVGNIRRQAERRRLAWLGRGRMHLRPVNGRGLYVMSNEMG